MKKEVKENINYMVRIGLPHCFFCHKEHEHLGNCTPSTPENPAKTTPCSKKCGEYYKFNPIMKKHTSPSLKPKSNQDKGWEIEFDKKFGDYLEINEGMTGLAVEEYHAPATRKVKSFIRKALTKQKRKAYEEGYKRGYKRALLLKKFNPEIYKKIVMKERERMMKEFNIKDAKEIPDWNKLKKNY